MDKVNKYSIKEFESALITGDEELASKIFEFSLTCDSPEWLNGYHPLRLALKYCNLKLARDFLNYDNVKVNNELQEKEDTPLHWAVVHYRQTRVEIKSILQLVLAKKPNLTKENLLKQTPFDIALQMNDKSTCDWLDWAAISVLINHVTDNNIDEGTFFKLIIDLISADRCSRLEHLIKNCTYDINNHKPNLNLLLLAVEKKNYEAVEILIKCGIDKNYYNKFNDQSKRAIDKACEMGDLKMVKLLLDNGVSVDHYTYFNNTVTSPIYTAIKHYHLDVVRELFDRGEDVNKIFQLRSRMYTPLHIACFWDNLKIVHFLISRGADIYYQDTTLEDSVRPIVEAFEAEGRDVFEYFIKLRNFRLYLNDAKSIAFSHPFTSYSGLDKFKIFFNYIQELDSRDPFRRDLDQKVFNNKNLERPLIHEAVLIGLPPHIEMLIKNGIDVDLKNSKGQTALHLAFWSPRGCNTIGGLIEMGADINLRCHEGHLPVTYHTNETLRKSQPKIDEDEWDLDEYSVDWFCRYVMALMSLRLFVDHENFNFVISRWENPFRNQKEYQNEIEKMKETNISATVPDKSYYGFVKSNLKQRIVQINDEKIMKALKNEEIYKEKFPYFAPVISNLFYQALARKNLLDKCDFFFAEFCEHLPYPCVMQIISYFSNEELRNLINEFYYA